jgi:hypothetical protein
MNGDPQNLVTTLYKKKRIAKFRQGSTKAAIIISSEDLLGRSNYYTNIFYFLLKLVGYTTAHIYLANNTGGENKGGKKQYGS